MLAWSGPHSVIQRLSDLIGSPGHNVNCEWAQGGKAGIDVLVVEFLIFVIVGEKVSRRSVSDFLGWLV